MSPCHSDRRSLRHLPYPGRRLGHLRQRRPFSWLGLCSGSSAPSLWGIWNGSLCGGHRRRGGAAVTGGATVTGRLPLLVGPPVLVGPPLQAGPLQSLAGMVGASWDLQAEGYQRGEGTDLVAPAELSPNGNRCPLGSIRAGPKPTNLYPVTHSNCTSMYWEIPERIVIPNRFPLRMVVN